MHKRHLLLIVILFTLFAGLPGVAAVMDQPYLLTIGTKILISAIAAVSLDLILGYGGMISFGHAAFLGVGAYAVGILSFHAPGLAAVGWFDGREALIVWPVAILCSAAMAFIIGALSLRTSGVHFIMITLAFAQMLYFIAISLEPYGGDDGLSLVGRSRLAGFSLSDDRNFYYVCLLLLTAFFWLCQKMVSSRFGYVIRGIKQNPLRMKALGFPIYRYQLVCFAIAGAGAGLAGALSANQSEFVSPDLLHWSKSGEIMIMVILGGIGTLLGPVLGSITLIGLEEGLALLTPHWMVFLGVILVAMVLSFRHGIYGLLMRGRDG